MIDLSLRTLVGTGVGYHWVQAIGGDAKQQFSSMGLILGGTSRRPLTDTVTLTQRLEVCPGLTGTRNNQAKFNVGLNVAMSSTLSPNVGFSEANNSKLAHGAKKSDTSFFTGINFKLCH